MEADEGLIGYTKLKLSRWSAWNANSGCVASGCKPLSGERVQTLGVWRRSASPQRTSKSMLQVYGVGVQTLSGSGVQTPSTWRGSANFYAETECKLLICYRCRASNCEVCLGDAR